MMNLHTCFLPKLPRIMQDIHLQYLETNPNVAYKSGPYKKVRNKSFLAIECTIAIFQT